MEVANSYFETVAQVKYLVRTVINENLIQKEITRIYKCNTMLKYNVAN
jgi:hypothetical protein